MYIAALLASMAFYLSSDRGQKQAYTIGICLLLILCTLSVNKRIEGDWVWYTKHYAILRDIGFSEYLGRRIGSITVKVYEPIYYLFAYLVGVTSNFSVKALSIWVTISVYVINSFAFYKANKFIADRNGVYPDPVIFIAAVLFSVSFTLVHQLVRQEIASAFSFLAIIYILDGKWKSYAIFSALAVFSHISSIFMIFIGTIVAIISMKSGKMLWQKAVSLISLMLGGYILGFIISASQVYGGEKSDGSVAIFLYFADFAILLVILSLYVFSINRLKINGFIIGTFAAFYSAYYMVSDNSILSLRLYFYIDQYRSLALMLIYYYIVRNVTVRQVRRVIAIIFLISSIVYQEVRISRSTFDFGGSILSTSLIPFARTR